VRQPPGLSWPSPSTHSRAGARIGPWAIGGPGEGFDQVIDRAGGDTERACLHDGRVQRLAGPAPALEQAREEAPGADTGNAQVQVAGLSGEHLLAIAVSPRGADVGVLAPRCTDVCRWPRPRSVPAGGVRPRSTRARVLRSTNVVTPAAGVGRTGARPSRTPVVELAVHHGELLGGLPLAQGAAARDRCAPRADNHALNFICSGMTIPGRPVDFRDDPGGGCPPSLRSATPPSKAPSSQLYP